MKKVIFALCAAAIATMSTAEPIESHGVTYKILISQSGKVLNSYLVPTASDATRPAIFADTTELLTVTECTPGKNPTLTPLRVGVFFELQPVKSASSDSLLTSYNFSVTNLKSKEALAADKDGCSLDLVKTSTIKLAGMAKVSSVPFVLSDDVDGRRITISIAN